MGFVSILGNTKIEDVLSKKQPDFFVDLNLDQVVNRIQKCSPDYSVKEFFYTFPAREDVRYRREIYQDIKKKNLYEGLIQFSSDMRRAVEIEVSPTFSGEPIQGACWQLEAVYHYCKAILELKKKLEEGIEKQEIAAEGWKALLDYFNELFQDADFAKMQEEAYRIWGMLKGTRFTLEINGNKVRISPAAQQGNYEDLLGECFEKFEAPQKGSMHSPFSGDLFLSRFERRMLQAYFGKHPELENEITLFAEKYQEYKQTQILQLEKEVQFYLAYYAFQKEWEAQGAVFSAPAMDEKKVMEAFGVYDLALACVNYPAKKKI